MTDERLAGSKYVRVFATRREWRGYMNNLIGKCVMVELPIKNSRGDVYDYVRHACDVVDFTDDLLQVLVVDISSGRLFLVPIEEVRVVNDNTH